MARVWGAAQPLRLQAKKAPEIGGSLKCFAEAAANNCLARSNKSRTRAKATNKRDGSEAQFHIGTARLAGPVAGSALPVSYRLDRRIIPMKSLLIALAATTLLTAHSPALARRSKEDCRAWVLKAEKACRLFRLAVP